MGKLSDLATSSYVLGIDFSHVLDVFKDNENQDEESFLSNFAADSQFYTNFILNKVES